MKAHFLLIFIVVLSVNSFAGDSHRHIPFFYTWSAKTLAGHLCSGLTGDSAKVEAIHYWICRHIAYDVKKYMNYDFTEVPVKKILRRRKAVCVGYADLFASLCGYAGIMAVRIPGYSKNKEVDIADTFYLDDHAWAAALVSGQWRLADPTWDAGVVIGYRRSIGKPVKLKYHPHFKRALTNNYFLIDPRLFIRTHLPVNPQWQLTDTMVSVEGFARDSSYYYSGHDFDSLDEPHYHDASYGLLYIAMDRDGRDKEDGVQSYAYNPRHHLHIADAWRIRAEEKGKEMKDKTVDSAYETALSDTAISYSQKAIAHYDSTLAMIRLERDQRLAFNKQKRDIFDSYHKDEVSATARNLGNLRAGIQSSKYARRSCKVALRNNQIMEINVQRSDGFRYEWLAKETKAPDSAAALKAIGSMQDSMASLGLILCRDSADLESLFLRCRSGAVRYADSQPGTQRMLGADIFTRVDFFDDFDYEIKAEVHPLSRHKQITDSALYINGRFLTDTLYETLYKYQADVRKLYAVYKSIAYDIKLLNRACQSESGMREKIKLNDRNMRDYLVRSGDFIPKWPSRAKLLQTYCRRQRKGTKNELKLLHYRGYLEQMNGYIRQREIGRKAAAYIRYSAMRRSLALGLLSKAKRHRLKYTR